MNKNKEKCKRLKEIRKQTADKLGIDLYQTECTYQGECSGTCPKCRQEEEKLNKALLGKAAVVLGVGLSLTACTPLTGTDNDEMSGDAVVITEEIDETEVTTENVAEPEIESDSGEDGTLTGAVEYIGE